MKANYLDPFTNFGFKKIFGQEASKPLLRHFLNALLPLMAQRELVSSLVARAAAPSVRASRGHVG